MKILLQIMLFCSALTSFGQDLNPEVKKLVKELIDVNELHHKHVSIGGETTDQYYNFLKLRNTATTAELISLLDHNNSTIKGYASWALADNKHPALDQILFKFLQSNETVTTFNGCIVSRDKLASEFYYRVLYQHYENDISSRDSLFFVEQIKKLDSVIVYQFENSTLIEEALSHNNANPENYERIKELAFKRKNEQALIELAKYNKSRDIDGFKKLGKKSFLAISYFPDHRFWPFLENYFDKDKSFELFMAVASFKNERATQTLSTIFTQLANDHDTTQIEKLDRALINHYCSYYQDLFLTIWEKYKFIDISATRNLINDNPQKASEGFTKGLLNSKRFKLIVLDYEYEFKDSILPLMLKNIAIYNRDKLFEICSNNIKNTEFIDLYVFLNFARDNRIDGLENVLIDKLNGERMAFDIYQLTETLLSYNNPDLEQKTIKILRANQRSWDWGNWSEQFQSLFKIYNIKV